MKIIKAILKEQKEFELQRKSEEKEDNNDVENQAPVDYELDFFVAAIEEKRRDELAQVVKLRDEAEEKEKA